MARCSVVSRARTLQYIITASYQGVSHSRYETWLSALWLLTKLVSITKLRWEHVLCFFIPMSILLGLGRCSCRCMSWIYTDIWWILPVVICSSSRLSHACLSVNHWWTANGSLKQLWFIWWYGFYTDNRSNSVANTCDAHFPYLLCNGHMHRRGVFISEVCWYPFRGRSALWHATVKGWVCGVET